MQGPCTLNESTTKNALGDKHVNIVRMVPDPHSHKGHGPSCVINTASLPISFFLAQDSASRERPTVIRIASSAITWWYLDTRLNSCIVESFETVDPIWTHSRHEFSIVYRSMTAHSRRSHRCCRGIFSSSSLGNGPRRPDPEEV